MTASVLVAFKAPTTTLVNAVGAPPLLKVTLALVAASSYLMPTAAAFATLVSWLFRLLTVELVVNSWLPLTASVLVAFKAPTATLVNAVEAPPLLKVTLSLVLTSSYLMPAAAVFVTLVS